MSCVAYLVVVGFLVTGCASLAYEKSDHFDGERFFNPGRPDTKGFGDFLRWQFEGGRAEWPASVENKVQPRLPEGPIPAGEVHLTYINHATLLLQHRSLTVLTDPIFAERASPVQWAGPKRVREPGLEWEKLPKIDVVVVSHNHYDHLNLPTLKRLAERDRPLFLVPLGNKKLLAGEGIERVEELDWWQSREIEGARGKFTLVPVQHWSARGLFDRNRALWGGFVIEVDGVRSYFGGDTGYGPHFKTVQEKFESFDLALLPIGAYEPRWFMAEAHMNPLEAVMAHQDLKSRFSVGIHFGTFRLTNESIDAPVEALKKARLERSVDPAHFAAPEAGETFVVKASKN